MSVCKSLLKAAVAARSEKDFKEMNKMIQAAEDRDCEWVTGGPKDRFTGGPLNKMFYAYQSMDSYEAPRGEQQ